MLQQFCAVMCESQILFLAFERCVCFFQADTLPCACKNMGMSLLQRPAGWRTRAQEQIGAIRTMAATAEDREVIDALLADAGERVRAQDSRAEAQACGPAQRRRVRCPS